MKIELDIVLRKNLYRDIALNQVPRILGFGNRNITSQTYGSFDRYYWHYKLKDLNNARFQEVALLLALLYKNEFQRNIYAKNSSILEWTKAVILFWDKIKNSDGSLNEIYPMERSFCATVMSTYAISEAILILDIKLPIDLEKVGHWISKNSKFSLSNQMAASALALINIFRLTSEKCYQKAAEDKIKNLLKVQDSAGYFPEYDGYDIGYQSLTLGFLSRYYKKFPNQQLSQAIYKGIEFLESKINDDGNYDNSGCSRNTKFIYPYTFAVFKSSIIKRVSQGLKSNKILNPAWLDDRYVIPLTIDYLETYLELNKC